MKTCFLCEERNDGLYALAVANFQDEAQRQLANEQRRQANEPARWFTAENLMGKLFTITSFPHKLCD